MFVIDHHRKKLVGEANATLLAVPKIANVAAPVYRGDKGIGSGELLLKREAPTWLAVFICCALTETNRVS